MISPLLRIVMMLSSSDDRVVSCRGVSRVYRGLASGLAFWRGDDGPRVTALSDVSLDVYRGEIVGVAGPSGSGKSTLLHLIAGLDSPTSGVVRVAGVDLGGVSEVERTRFRLEHVGIVFQRFHLLPALSALDNVGLPLIQLGVSRGRRRARAMDLLEMVGLGERAGHKPGQLSGGEQQRVAIARALVTDPDVLLADEPTGELDTRTGGKILGILSEFAGDRGIVVASHDENVHSIADRVIRLRDGRRVE